MAYFKRANNWQSVFFSRGMALAMIVLVAFVGYGVFSIATKSVNAAKARRLAEADATALAQKQIDLEKKTSALDTDAGKEEVLRDQYPVVKPGEHVVVITDADQGTVLAASAAHSIDQGNIKPGFWSFLKNLFK
jgi:hypothetical protein